MLIKYKDANEFAKGEYEAILDAIFKIFWKDIDKRVVKYIEDHKEILDHITINKNNGTKKGLFFSFNDYGSRLAVNGNDLLIDYVAMVIQLYSTNERGPYVIHYGTPDWFKRDFAHFMRLVLHDPCDFEIETRLEIKPMNSAYMLQHDIDDPLARLVSLNINLWFVEYNTLPMIDTNYRMVLKKCVVSALKGN